MFNLMESMQIIVNNKLILELGLEIANRHITLSIMTGGFGRVGV